MSWRFRKVFGSGPFRTSLSKKGFGFSFGVPGLRFGVSPDGRRYISVGIPRTGLYWIKYLNNNSQQGQQQPMSSPPVPTTQIPSTQVTPPSKNQKQPWWKQKGLND